MFPRTQLLRFLSLSKIPSPNRSQSDSRFQSYYLTGLRTTKTRRQPRGVRRYDRISLLFRSVTDYCVKSFRMLKLLGHKDITGAKNPQDASVGLANAKYAVHRSSEPISSRTMIVTWFTVRCSVFSTVLPCSEHTAHEMHVDRPYRVLKLSHGTHIVQYTCSEQVIVSLYWTDRRPTVKDRRGSKDTERYE